MNYKIKLNDEQKEAVYCDSAGSVKVEAGAGTGKTRVLIARTLYLESKGIKPKYIKTIAYTRNVRSEINQRLRKQGSECKAKTIHSLCLDILKRNPLSSYQKYEKLDEVKQHKKFKRYLKTLAPELVNDSKAIINHFNQNGLKGRKATAYLPKNWREHEEQLTKVISRYAVYKDKNKLLDYNDMIIKTAELLENPKAALQTAKKIRHILVDEAQDLSKPMWSIIKALKNSGTKVFLVGDQAQAIMGFAGAYVEQFNSFEADYDDVKFVRLLENYRCSPEILTLSNWCRKEVSKKLKPINANRKSNEKPLCLDATSFDNAAVQVVNYIKRHNLIGSTSVLVRTNAQSNKVEEKIEEAGLLLKSKIFPKGIEVLTVHKAKGREWQNCFVIDPRLGRSMASDQQTEHCLCYVSLTRAMSKLVLLFCTKGKIFNQNPRAKETYIFDKFPRKLCG